MAFFVHIISQNDSEWLVFLWKTHENNKKYLFSSDQTITEMGDRVFNTQDRLLIGY